MTVATTAPLPALRHLFALARRPAADDVALAGPWLHRGDTSFLFSRAAWALRAVADAQAASSGRRPLVWLPDYFCDQATGPLRVSATLAFYPIDEDLQPNWGVCESMARQRPDLFVLVHYFGRPIETATAHAFCKAYGALLVEDAAHVLAPCATVGRAGDATVWSLYKHLPLPDCGLLTMRAHGGLDAAAVESAARALGHRAPAACGWIAKRVLQRLAPSQATRLHRAAIPFDRDPPPAPLAEEPAMSSTARRLLAVLGSEVEAIGGRRRANERALRQALGDTDLRPLLPAPGESWTPYRAVFRAPSEARARYWYDRFNAAGNVVESWPDLPGEIRLNSDQHRVALALRATVLALPVHADRTPEELARAYGAAA